MSTPQMGVLIESGPSDFHIYQQDKTGHATISLSGSWRIPTTSNPVSVQVKIVDEQYHRPVSHELDWRDASISKQKSYSKEYHQGSWKITLKGVPAGGLYRIETRMMVRDVTVSGRIPPNNFRGDIVHHIGVGDVWLIVGQSNAVGYGRDPVEDQPQLGVHMFHPRGQWKLATQPLGDSTGTCYPANKEMANAGHSPALAFAKKLKNKLGYPIGLIPTALGGSPISSWNKRLDGRLFDNMAKFTNDAGGKCKGVLWYQGESDAISDEVKLYTTRFKQVVSDMRKLFADHHLPIITVQLNRCFWDWPKEKHEAWNAMQEVQRQLPKKMANIYVVGTLDLPTSDVIHTSASGNIVLGHRMADTALGGVYGHAIKYQCPDLSCASLTTHNKIKLTFDHVDETLILNTCIPTMFPFAVFDQQGKVPIASWHFPKANILEIKLTKKILGRARVICAPTAAAPPMVPMDLSSWRPMLAFTVNIAAVKTQ